MAKIKVIAIILLILLFSHTAFAELKYNKNYEFVDTYLLRHFDSGRAEQFSKVLKEFVGKKICYLEIGLAEGGSFFWIWENILTNPESTAIGIDIFIDNNWAVRFFSNLEMSGFKDRVSILKGESQVMLRQVTVDSVDVIYIDGSHKTRDVLQDAVICWKILKQNGIMIFDDYYNLPGVKVAADIFVDAFRDDIAVEYRNNRIFVIRKL